MDASPLMCHRCGELEQELDTMHQLYAPVASTPEDEAKWCLIIGLIGGGIAMLVAVHVGWLLLGLVP